MNKTLTKQDHHELLKCAREINSLEREIQERKTKWIEEGGAIVMRAIEIGQKLIQANIRLKPTGDWLLWLEGNVSVKEDQARRYMRIASNAARVRDASSLRQALALLSEGENSSPTDQKEARQLIPYLEALGRISKFCGYVSKHPMRDWPEEGKEKAREDLEPVARELWPERFG